MSTKEKGRIGWHRCGHAYYYSHSTAHSTSGGFLVKRFCCCRPGIPCIVCLMWDRLIRRVELRRRIASAAP